MRLLRLPRVLIASILMAPTAQAGIIYNDGGTHTLNSAVTTNVVVSKNTTLLIGPGASITPASGVGLTAMDQVSTVVITGGTFTAGPASDAVDIFPQSLINISGGTFTAGVGTAFNGAAGLVLLGQTSGPPLSGPDTISGGVFQGNQNGVGLAALHAVTITGGTFTGGAGSFQVELFDAGPVIVKGGTFQGGWDLIFNAWSLSLGSVIEVMGTGLTYSGGQLIGILQDGSPIDVAVTIGSGVPVHVTSTEIIFGAPLPEPSSVLLLGLGLAGVAVAGWLRRG